MRMIAEACATSLLWWNGRVKRQARSERENESGDDWEGDDMDMEMEDE